jgi:FixJ family two-component response regulator
MLAGLTDIERQVLNGIIRGQCEEAIASELLLGLPDVQRHRSDLMGKLRMRRTIFEKQKTAP